MWPANRLHEASIHTLCGQQIGFMWPANRLHVASIHTLCGQHTDCTRPAYILYVASKQTARSQHINCIWPAYRWRRAGHTDVSASLQLCYTGRAARTHSNVDPLIATDSLLVQSSTLLHESCCTRAHTHTHTYFYHWCHCIHYWSILPLCYTSRAAHVHTHTHTHTYTHA